MKKKSVKELLPFMDDALKGNLSLEVAFKEGYNFAISEMGRIGGQIKSEAKTQASRINGKKGGRPRLTSQKQPFTTPKI